MNIFAQEKKDLLRLQDWSAEALQAVIAHAAALKATPPAEQLRHQGRTLLLFFEKHSTRTRLSFQTAAHQLGAQSIFLSPDTSQAARGEPVEDTAAMFGIFCDAIAIRTFGQDRIEDFAAHADAPVINALTDMHHPCQILADVLTMQEEVGDLASMKVAYFGDGNNVVHSLAAGALAFGYELHIATPSDRCADPGLLRELRDQGARIVETSDAESAARDAHALYTDTWVSMGDAASKEEVQKIFADFQVNKALMSLATPAAIFLHCLPAYRGMEVSAEVIDGPRSRVLQQAANRLHAQKALIDIMLDKHA